MEETEILIQLPLEGISKKKQYEYPVFENMDDVMDSFDTIISECTKNNITFHEMKVNMNMVLESGMRSGFYQSYVLDRFMIVDIEDNVSQKKIFVFPVIDQFVVFVPPFKVDISNI